MRLYGNESFCLVLEQKLGLHLFSPADDLLVSLDRGSLGRRVARATVATLTTVNVPAFVKSLVPKLIRARVYSSTAELLRECNGLEPETGLLVSEPVEIEAEARCFVLDGKILDCAFYEGAADLDAARAFAGEVVTRAKLPRAVVLDVGVLRDGKWVVVEFNAAWGSGLNGCNPELVVPAVEAATALRQGRDPNRLTSEPH